MELIGGANKIFEVKNHGMCQLPPVDFKVFQWNSSKTMRNLSHVNAINMIIIYK